MIVEGGDQWEKGARGVQNPEDLFHKGICAGLLPGLEEAGLRIASGEPLTKKGERGRKPRGRGGGKGRGLERKDHGEESSCSESTVRSKLNSGWFLATSHPPKDKKNCQGTMAELLEHARKWRGKKVWGIIWKKRDGLVA